MLQGCVRRSFMPAYAPHIPPMQQSSNNQGASTLHRTAQVIIVILALVVLLVASSMLVTAGDQLAAFEPNEQHTMPHPGPTAPPPQTF